ncbi:MAG: hypothetical protein HRU18_22510 [Pseudoalteromonas sp.]|jgi:hypothetical protein|uniref:AAA domain-containing protein n=1 Tax=Neptunicella marina TaxID=2125989 RepID=A0A8J6IV57_9ALTE|nr:MULTISPECIES: AAA family ATPase [Alteromonadales]MBC3767281.1 hypothetical protein [Neptunicella marina]NRA80987.1 hypothetical protein [Pseudoalteromonas sp.]
MRKKFKSDKERLQALEAAFLSQTAEAFVKNKLRGIATMKVICKVADVDTTYVYGHKNPSPEDKKKYDAFVAKVNLFAETFKSRDKKIVSDEVDLEEQLQNARDNNFVLKYEVNELKIKLSNLNKELMGQKTNNVLSSVLGNPKSPASQLNENTISVVSPDIGLIHNNRYEFSNVKLREKAWREAKLHFQKLMKRSVPQRVFILIGLPSSGKSTWAQETRDFNKDRHSVIVDSTNLTKGERAQWIMLARKAKDVKICAVRFLVDFTTIKERNILNTQNNKFIDVEILEKKRDSIEEIDFEFEDIDEVIIVRHDQ